MPRNMPVYTPGVVPTAQYPTWAASIYLDRADGQSPVSDSFTVPANAKQQLPVARPQTSIVVTVGGNARTVTESATPAVGTVGYDRTTGIYTFNAADIGGAAVVAYTPLQTVITAGRMMAIESEIELHQDTFTAGPELGSVSDGELVQFSSTGGRDVEGSGIMAEDVTQAIADATAAVDARGGRAYQSIPITGAGPYTITPDAAAGSLFLVLPIEDGSYTAPVSIATTNATEGDSVEVLADFDAGTSPTVEIRNATSGGTLLATLIGSGAPTRVFLRLRFSGSAWQAVSAPTLPLVSGGTGATSASAARTNLGLGTIATQAASAVAITGGTIEGTAIGGTTAAAVRGTTLTATAQQGCGVYHATTQTIANNTWTGVQYNTEDWDNGTTHSTVSNTSRLTAPVAGVYLVTANVAFAANATGVRQVVVGKNGTTPAAGVPGWGIQLQAADGTNGNRLTVSVALLLAANDYIEIFVIQNSGGDLAVGSASDQRIMSRATFIRLT